MAVLLQDDFNRANSTTSLGSPVTGGPYTVQSGVWGISNNEAYLSTAPSNAHVTFPAAINIDLSARIPVTPSSSLQPGLTFRYADVNNHWLLLVRNTLTLSLWHCAAGTYTELATAPFAVNDVVGVKAYGDQIGWFSNGRQLGQMTDAWFASAGTGAGLRSGGVTSGRWDDLLAQDQLAPWSSWGASPEGATDLELIDAASALIPSLYKGRNTAFADESEIP